MKHVLYVEDNEADAAIAREALVEIGAKVRLHHVDNGVQAFQFLGRRGVHREAPAPDLIILDLNLPVMTGHQVLAELKADPHWARVPVVVYTSSRSPRDAAAVGRFDACLVVKPSTWQEQVALARSLVARLEAGGAAGGEASAAAASS